MTHPQNVKHSGLLRAKFEAVDAASGVFEGYGSIFGNVDQGGDIVERGAFAASLAAHERKGTTPVMLWMHKQDVPIGRWLSMEEDAVGLLVRGQLNLKTTAGRDAWAHVSDGDVSGLSIGYAIPPGGAAADDRHRGVTRLKRVDLHEVSIVTLPMNDVARIRLGSKGDLEELLMKGGLPKEAARRVAFGGWPALNQNPEQNLSPLLDALRASANRF